MRGVSANAGRLHSWISILAFLLAACGGATLESVSSSDGGHDRDSGSGNAKDSDSGSGDAKDSSRDATDGSRDAGGSPACASLGSVTFRMQGPADDAGYTYAFSFGNPGDGVWWYSLAKADGTAVQIFFSELATCGSCTPQAEPIGAGCSPLPAGGVTATWDGTAVTGESTCQWSDDGGQVPEAIECDVTQCMPAGKYVVTMCGGCPDFESDAAAPCLAVPFDYPSTSDVVGNLPP